MNMRELLSAVALSRIAHTLNGEAARWHIARRAGATARAWATAWILWSGW